MTDDPVDPDSSDPESLDPDLVEQFDRLQETKAPDLWNRIAGAGSIDSGSGPFDDAELQVPPVTLVSRGANRAWPSRWVLAAAAMFLGAGAIGANSLLDRANTPEGVIELGTDGSATTVQKPGEIQGPASCITSELAESLRQELPDFDYEPSTSPSNLFAQSSIAVRGQLSEATNIAGGTMIYVKSFDLVGPGAEDGPRINSLWTPAMDAPSGFLGAEFVAFLPGDTILTLTGGDPLWPTYLEGLWVSCDESGLAESVLAEPFNPGWDEIKAGGVRLDELWQVAQFPTGASSVPLGEPTHSVDGADVFDLQLAEGERFRLSVPEGLAADASVVQLRNIPGAKIESANMTATITYGFCENQDSLAINALGSEVGLDESGISVCRSDELLAMSVDLSSLESNESAVPFFNTWDVRPIVPGGPYGERLREFKPELGSCGNCDSNGPMFDRKNNVVVNRTGQTTFTAVDLDTLEEVWTFDTEGFGSAMHAGDEAVYFSDPAGPFIKVATETGAEIWRNDFVDEHGLRVYGLADGTMLLKTAFASEGDSRAPLLRRIDEISGEIIWVGEGREWGAWQGGAIPRLNGIAILMDTYDNPSDPQAAGGALFGFDMDTGETLWVTELDVTSSAFGSNTLAILTFSQGNILVARTVDGDLLRVVPESGELLWRAQVGATGVGGTEFDRSGNIVISVTTRTGQVLVDPETGEVVS